MGKLFASVAFYLILGPAYLISLLPFAVLYRLSDFFAFFLHSVLRYRRRLIRGHLETAFPRKSAEEIAQITRDFYRNLADVSLESIKMWTVSAEEIGRRVRMVDFDILGNYFAQGRSVVCMMGHFGNWEYGAAAGNAARALGAEPVTIYKKINLPVADRWFRRTRGRFGFRLLDMASVNAFYGEQNGRPSVCVYIADQSPAVPRRAIWTEFLGRSTPVFYGPELLARRRNMPVVFARMTRTRRGYYELRVIDLVPEPQQTAKGEITAIHTQYLEQMIREQPADWLWSHKRWKHQPAPSQVEVSKTSASEEAS